MKFGSFDNKNREYVITNPKTPVKWINYIGTLAFGGFIDHTGGLLICKGDPTLNRITKYFQQMPSSDFKGSTFYIRIEEKNGYKLFSPFFTPTLDGYESYECRVGLQYSRFITVFYGIKSDILVFVPKDETRVIFDVTITNESGKALSLDFIPVIEYTHPQALKQIDNGDWVPQTMQSKAYDSGNGTMVLAQYAFFNRDTAVNFLASSYPVSSFESDRKIFLGDNEYGNWTRPLSLMNKNLSNTEALRGDNIGVLLHELGELEPGDRKRIVLQLGQVPSITDALPSIRKYHSVEEVEKGFSGLAAFWDEKLDIMQVSTPDESMNSMLNVHNAYQNFITFNWSRYLSLYQYGLGSRGIGFRDTSQDSLGVMDRHPQTALEMIKKLLMVQRMDGCAMHMFNPLSMIAERGDAKEMEDRLPYYSDDHLWIILAVTEYIKETGDEQFLEEVIPFYEKNKNGTPIESGAVYDHMKRAIEFTRKNIGKHGFPLLGFADWNDCVNLQTGAESLFTTCLYGKALLEMNELAEFRKDPETIAKCKEYYREMKDRFNAHAWDGDWYISYFDWDGSPLGSKQNDAGKIFVHSQAWAIISGFATGERMDKTLDSIYRHLNTKKGIKLSTPGYNGYDKNVGGISSYPPGTKENGGIFLHTNPWVMIAETMRGNGERAFEYYSQINPATKNDIIEEFECEPYVYPQNILGDEHPQFGLGRNSWLSGTASWVYQAGMKFILGVRPTYSGMEINPCIPSEWDGYGVKRKYRGATYSIDVKNPGHLNKGVKTIEVDGKKIKGTVVPIFSDGKTHKITVVMG